MQTRLETLQRLFTLYAAVEELHSTELQRMTAAVREAQQVIRAEQEVARAARLEILLEREELSEAAREQYVVSRLRREQIKCVFDDIALRMEIEEGRRLQAASDDRFLARRRWTDAREATGDKQRMKAS
jgi:2-phospho-L-lactate guanylyltransferase (CobY/MobA/RfbA family)